MGTSVPTRSANSACFRPSLLRSSASRVPKLICFEKSCLTVHWKAMNKVGRISAADRIAYDEPLCRVQMRRACHPADLRCRRRSPAHRRRPRAAGDDGSPTDRIRLHAARDPARRGGPGGARRLPRAARGTAPLRPGDRDPARCSRPRSSLIALDLPLPDAARPANNRFLRRAPPDRIARFGEARWQGDGEDGR